MEKCPMCHHFSIETSSSNKAQKCTVDGCSCEVYDTSSYSYLKPEPLEGTISRVKVEEGNETQVIKKYHMI